MRKVWMLVLVAVGGALLGSAGTAGGVLCMLRDRDVTIGKTMSAPKDGVCQVQPLEGAGKELRLGPETRVVRIERIKADQIRAGDEFVSRNAANGAPSPAVVVFSDQMDLWTLYNAVGHGTTRSKTAGK